MLVYKALQVVATSEMTHDKPWEMVDEKTGQKRTGVSNFCDVTVLSSGGGVAVIRLKGKNIDEVKAKLSKLTVGKPAEIQITGMDAKQNSRGVLVLNA